MAVEGTEQPFKDYWASTIYPTIQADYQRLLLATPTRIAEKDRAKKEKKSKKEDKDDKTKATAEQEKLLGVMAEVKEKGERRNAYMNLAWTGPTSNSYLSEKISKGKVENMAADFCPGEPALRGSG